LAGCRSWRRAPEEPWAGCPWCLAPQAPELRRHDRLSGWNPKHKFKQFWNNNHTPKILSCTTLLLKDLNWSFFVLPDTTCFVPLVWCWWRSRFRWTFWRRHTSCLKKVGLIFISV
jgi:hypothetical protein